MEIPVQGRSGTDGRIMRKDLSKIKMTKLYIFLAVVSMIVWVMFAVDKGISSDTDLGSKLWFLSIYAVPLGLLLLLL